MHATAIMVLEDEARALERLSDPNQNTVTQFYADKCKADAKALRETIEFLKKAQHEHQP